LKGASRSLYAGEQKETAIFMEKEKRKDYTTSLRKATDVVPGVGHTGDGRVKKVTLAANAEKK